MAAALEATVRQVTEATAKAGVTERSYLNLAVSDGRRAVVSRFTTGPPAEAATLYAHEGKQYVCEGDVCRMVEPGGGLGRGPGVLGAPQRGPGLAAGAAEPPGRGARGPVGVDPGLRNRLTGFSPQRHKGHKDSQGTDYNFFVILCALCVFVVGGYRPGFTTRERPKAVSKRASMSRGRHASNPSTVTAARRAGARSGPGPGGPAAALVDVVGQASTTAARSRGAVVLGA